MQEQPVIKCKCGARLAIPEKLFGQTIACPACGHELNVPDFAKKVSETDAPDTNMVEARVAVARVTNDTAGPVRSVASSELADTAPMPIVQIDHRIEMPENRPTREMRRVRSMEVATILWLAGMVLTLIWTVAVLVKGASLDALERQAMALPALVGLLGVVASALVIWAKGRSNRPRPLLAISSVVVLLWNIRDVAAAIVLLEGGRMSSWMVGGQPYADRDWLVYEIIHGLFRVAIALVILQVISGFDRQKSAAAR